MSTSSALHSKNKKLHYYRFQENLHLFFNDDRKLLPRHFLIIVR